MRVVLHDVGDLAGVAIGQGIVFLTVGGREEGRLVGPHTQLPDTRRVRVPGGVGEALLVHVVGRRTGVLEPGLVLGHQVQRALVVAGIARAVAIAIGLGRVPGVGAVVGLPHQPVAVRVRRGAAVVHHAVAVIVRPVAADLGDGGDLVGARAVRAVGAGLRAAVAEAHVLRTGEAGITGLGHHLSLGAVHHAVAIVVEAVAGLGHRLPGHRVAGQAVAGLVAHPGTRGHAGAVTGTARRVDTGEVLVDHAIAVVILPIAGLDARRTAGQTAHAVDAVVPLLAGIEPLPAIPLGVAGVADVVAVGVRLLGVDHVRAVVRGAGLLPAQVGDTVAIRVVRVAHVDLAVAVVVPAVIAHFLVGTVSIAVLVVTPGAHEAGHAVVVHDLVGRAPEGGAQRRISQDTVGGTRQRAALPALAALGVVGARLPTGPIVPGPFAAHLTDAVLAHAGLGIDPSPVAAEVGVVLARDVPTHHVLQVAHLVIVAIGMPEALDATIAVQVAHGAHGPDLIALGVLGAAAGGGDQVAPTRAGRTVPRVELGAVADVLLHAAARGLALVARGAHLAVGTVGRLVALGIGRQAPPHLPIADVRLDAPLSGGLLIVAVTAEQRSLLLVLVAIVAALGRLIARGDQEAQGHEDPEGPLLLDVHLNNAPSR